jgi:hypothetical protein
MLNTWCKRKQPSETEHAVMSRQQIIHLYSAEAVPRKDLFAPSHTSQRIECG